MNILSIENISKSYTEKVLFQNITFGIDEGQKIGLIGINGTGKSTLLKVTAGVETPDEGNVVKGKNIQVQYLSQNPIIDKDATVLEQIFQGDQPIMKLLRGYQQILEKLKQNPEDTKLQQELIEFNTKMDAADAWKVESDAKSILTKLGINDFGVKVGTMSGGQKRRIFLAAALIHPSDLLIMDEPTNHLDSETIEWLEEYLQKRKGALLMITHDRYFLDRVVNEIIELDGGQVYRYDGNYTLYVQGKAERERVLASKEQKRQRLYKQELAWIRAGVQGRGTKQKARIQRFEELKNEKNYTSKDTLDISVGFRRLGKKIIEMDNVTKILGNKVCVKDFEYVAVKSDRIGIVGPNGIGKSTLLNMIAQKMQPDEGDVSLGDTVKVGYYSQGNEHMEPNMRVIDYIKEEAEVIYTAEGNPLTASQMLERFLFPPDLQYTPIEKLSGGEKRRLYLLRVLMSAPNVLLLDEPTNDLDIHTLNILEDYIQGFAGPVIVVSHDRYFLDKVVEHILCFKQGGQISKYPGNYSDYERMKKEQKMIKQPKKQDKSQVPRRNKQAIKFSYKEQKEYEQIDEKIEKAETKLEQLQEEMGQCQSDFVRLQELMNEKEEKEQEYEQVLERWTYLNELAEKIEESKKQKR